MQGIAQYNDNPNFHIFGIWKGNMKQNSATNEQEATNGVMSRSILLIKVQQQIQHLGHQSLLMMRPSFSARRLNEHAIVRHLIHFSSFICLQ
jgi:hypothetical protein